MRKVSTAFAMLIASLFFSSCADMFDNDDNIDNPYYVSFGVIQPDNNGRHSNTILLDDGTRLNVKYSLVGAEEYDKSSDRILFNYTLMNKNDDVLSKNYDIRLNKLYDMLSKPIVDQSRLNADVNFADSVGNDPINVLKAELSGEYLNLQLRVEHGEGKSEGHFINLVYDDTDVSNNTITLTVRHHRFNGSSKGQYGDISASFKISELLATPDLTVNVVLKWNWYDNSGNVTEYSDNGTYTPKISLLN